MNIRFKRDFYLIDSNKVGLNVDKGDEMEIHCLKNHTTLITFKYLDRIFQNVSTNLFEIIEEKSYVPDKLILTTGDLQIGFTFYGPFNTFEELDRFVDEKKLKDFEYSSYNLTDPEIAI